jgi:hypothetical protein
MAEPPQGEKECCDRKAFVALSVGVVAEGNRFKTASSTGEK